ncbi:MAG: phosphotransferase family protein [Phycisphaerae bacterium]
MKPLADTTFPSLPVALDVEAVRDLLRGALPECREELELTDIKIYDVQYKPGAHCKILYRSKFFDKAVNRSTRQLLSARLLPPDQSPTPMSPELLARYEALPARVLRTAMTYLPEARMAVYAFPADPALPGLIDACDPVAMKQGLGRMWEHRRARVRRVIIQRLGYTPESRAALLYEVLSEAKDTGLPEARRLVGKIDAFKRAPRLFASAWAVWRAANNRVNVAPPVGYIASANLWLQEHVQGSRLADLAGSETFLKPVRQTAKALAILHGLEFPLRSRRTPEKEAAVVYRWGSVLAAIRPDQARRIKRLRNRLAAEIESRATPAGPVHGDLHPSNIIVGDGRVTLIDVDSMAYGDPLVDVGRFLASLRTSSLRVFGVPSGLSEAGEGFLDRYLACVSADEARVRLFEAACLLISAAAGFRLQRAGWADTAAILLDEVERVFALAERSAAALPGVGMSPRHRALENGSLWMKDGQYMRAVLDSHIRKAYGAEVSVCRVDSKRVTEKHQRIRYRFSGRRRGEKWALSLEGIAWRGRRSGVGPFKRLSVLRKALDGNPEAPLLPRPVAYLPEICLQVTEAMRGVRLPSLLATPRGPEVTARLARALAVLHGTRVELNKTRSLDDELLRVRRRIDGLGAHNPEITAQAAPLLARLEERIHELPKRIAPVLRKLSPNHILCLEDQVALTDVEDVVLSHPFIDVADFLARLTVMGIQQGRSDEAAELAKAFRTTYLAPKRANGEGLEAFEALALLHLACSEAARITCGMTAEHLLSDAGGLLAAARDSAQAKSKLCET